MNAECRDASTDAHPCVGCCSILQVMAVAGEGHWDWSDGVLVVASLAIPYGFAMVFFSQWLFKDYESRYKVVQVGVFAAASKRAMQTSVA